MIDRACPLCGKQLVKQSAREAMANLQDIYCPGEVILPEDKRVVNHYHEDSELEEIIIHIHPYRIITFQGKSSVAVRKRYKTKRGKSTDRGILYYKTIFKCDEIHVDTEEKLRERIKLLVLMS